MPASKHLLVVNSRPTVVSPSLWQKWYALEHLPDLVNSKTSTRAALYQEIAFLLNPNPTHPRTFLAVYQTEFEEPLKSQEYGNARSTSELFKREGGSDKIPDNGDFDARNYTLIQEFDPKGTGEQPSPDILTAEIHPTNLEDFEAWYREEHLNLLAKMPGYRRSLRYRLGPCTLLTSKDGVPPYLAVHEFDDLNEAFKSKEAAAANTPWTKKQHNDSKAFIVRGWKRLHQEGY